MEEKGDGRQKDIYIYIRYIKIRVEQKDSDGWGEILVFCFKLTKSHRNTYLQAV